jgi:Fe-S cluster assembly protein SufB
MTDWRIESFRAWQEMQSQNGLMYIMQNQTFQAISLFSTKSGRPKTLDDVDPELLEMYKKLGISVDEQR